MGNPLLCPHDPLSIVVRGSHGIVQTYLCFIPNKTYGYGSLQPNIRTFNSLVREAMIATYVNPHWLAIIRGRLVPLGPHVILFEFSNRIKAFWLGIDRPAAGQ